MRPTDRFTLAICLCGALASACSTKLIVHAIEADEAKDARAANPQGVVINRLGAYSVEVRTQLPITIPKKVARVQLVDPHRLLEVDYCRLPFANGKLTLELTKNAQTMVKAGVAGTTPVTNIVKAADKGVATATKLKELSEPAETP